MPFLNKQSLSMQCVHSSLSLPRVNWEYIILPPSLSTKTPQKLMPTLSSANFGRRSRPTDVVISMVLFFFLTYCSEINTAHGNCLTAKKETSTNHQKSNDNAKIPQTPATQAEWGWAAQILTYSFPDPREINLYVQSITKLTAKRAVEGADSADQCMI